MKLVMFAAPYRVDEHLSGVGLRLWELAQVLAAERITVTIAAAPRARGASALSWPGVHIVDFTEDTWPLLVEDCEAVLTTDLPDPRVLLAAHDAGRLIVTENAVPYEHLDYTSLRADADPQARYGDILDAFRVQTLLSDHFLARSEPERAGLLAALATAGRLTVAHHALSPTLDHLISLLPIGFNRFSAAHAADAAVSALPVDLLWNGGIWDYLDPIAALTALAALRDDGVLLSMRFLYPAVSDIPAAGHLPEQVHALGLDGQVDIAGEALPYTARDGHVKPARVIVCLGKDGIENHTCHRLRLRDALLYRLPVLIDSHGASGMWAKAHGIGAAIDPADTTALAVAMRSLAHDTATRRIHTEAITACRDRLSYEANTEGLLRFLDTGRRAPDSGNRWQTTALSELLSTHPGLREPPQPLL